MLLFNNDSVCAGDNTICYTSDNNWDMGISKIQHSIYLSSTHSVIIQGPVHNVPSHHNSSQHLCDHNISPGHHRGCARDCSCCWVCAVCKI